MGTVGVCVDLALDWSDPFADLLEDALTFIRLSLLFRLVCVTSACMSPAVITTYWKSWGLRLTLSSLNQLVIWVYL